jgi:ribosome-binding protein aMBF1 (putative translation factor)
MIRNESAYQEAVQRLEAERKRLSQHRDRLKHTGLTPQQIKRAIDPMRSFHLQLAEEVHSYERLKRGNIGELKNLHGLGQALVALRIALGLTQRELAKRLEVDESQVSSDERNDYHGITVDRASRILDAMGVELLTDVNVEPAATDRKSVV